MVARCSPARTLKSKRLVRTQKRAMKMPPRPTTRYFMRQRSTPRDSRSAISSAPRSPTVASNCMTMPARPTTSNTIAWNTPSTRSTPMVWRQASTRMETMASTNVPARINRDRSDWRWCSPSERKLTTNTIHKSGVTNMPRLRNQLQNRTSVFHRSRGASIRAATASAAKASMPSEKQKWKGRSGRWRRMAIASVMLLTMARTADNDSIVIRLINALLLDLRQRLHGFVLVGILAARRHDTLEVLLGDLRLSHLLGGDTGVGLDLGSARL